MKKTIYMWISFVLLLFLFVFYGNISSNHIFQDDSQTSSKEYIVLEKSPDRNFIILNLTDTQLYDNDWDDGNTRRKVLEYTITELINKVQPDLITISGDIAAAKQFYSYQMFADFIESFAIPWAPILGNHDNENANYVRTEFGDFVPVEAYESTDEDLSTALTNLEDLLMQYDHCLFTKGPVELGSGNYIISIEQNKTPITGVILLDTHSESTYIDEYGNEYQGYSSLNKEQKSWYSRHATNMKNSGYKDSAIIMHIPMYSFKEAFDAAFVDSIEPDSITVQESYDAIYWNDGYTESFGVRYEPGGYPPVDDGMLEIITDIGHTKNVIAGHDHINNFVINYRGVSHIYALKTGVGSYSNQQLNGGTVIEVSDSGITNVYHEYISIDHILSNDP